MLGKQPAAIAVRKVSIVIGREKIISPLSFLTYKGQPPFTSPFSSREDTRRSTPNVGQPH